MVDEVETSCLFQDGVMFSKLDGPLLGFREVRLAEHSRC